VFKIKLCISSAFERTLIYHIVSYSLSVWVHKWIASDLCCRLLITRSPSQHFYLLTFYRQSTTLTYCQPAKAPQLSFYFKFTTDQVNYILRESTAIVGLASECTEEVPRFLGWSDVTVINLWSWCDLCVVGHDVVLWKVNWWRFVALFKWNWIGRFKKSLVLATDRRSDCRCCKMFTFPCPTSWRPEQLA